MQRVWARLFCLCFAAALAAGCSGAHGSSGGVIPQTAGSAFQSPIESQQTTGAPRYIATAVGPNAFAANGAVFVTPFQAGSGGLAPIEMTQGIDWPASMAFDADGNLYVANDPVGQPGSIAVYAPPYSGAPALTIGAPNGIGAPSFLAIDSRNNRLAVAQNGFAGEVVMYSLPLTHASTPLAKLEHIALGFGSIAETSGKRYVVGAQVAMNAAGDVFVINCGRSCKAAGADSVVVFRAPSYSLAGSISAGITGPTGLAVDSKGNLFVSTCPLCYGKHTTTGGTVLEFRAPYAGTKPRQTIDGKNLSEPFAIGMDSLDDLFVASGGSNPGVVESKPPYANHTLALTSYSFAFTLGRGANAILADPNGVVYMTASPWSLLYELVTGVSGVTALASH